MTVSPNNPSPNDAGPRRPPPGASAPGQVTLGLAGAVAPLILAAIDGAGWPLALVASGCVAALALIAPRRPSQEPAPVPPPRPMEPEPPFRAMLDRLSDPIVMVEGGDRDDLNARRYVFANAAARDLLRINRPSGPLTTAIRAPEVLAVVDEALFETVARDVMYETGGAQDRVWRARAAPLGDTPWGARLCVLILRDETEFRRSEQTRADFLANASHELRTPLASLTGFIETLRGHARDDEQARERFLAIMHIQAERMRRLIDDLMSLSRIELGEHIPPSGEVDLALAVIDVIDALGPLAAERGVKFVQSAPPLGSATLVGDRDQILQVVQNLVENALKYSPDGGEVGVEVETGLDMAAATAPRTDFRGRLSLLTPDHSAEIRYAALRVRDAGPGIRRAYLARLTERFYRVEGQKTGETAGTGLGLAIVKHIANRHRGGLVVESEEGRGTLFIVYAPLIARPAA